MKCYKKYVISDIAVLEHFEKKMIIFFEELGYVVSYISRSEDHRRIWLDEITLEKQIIHMRVSLNFQKYSNFYTFSMDTTTDKTEEANPASSFMATHKYSKKNNLDDYGKSFVKLTELFIQNFRDRIKITKFLEQNNQKIHGYLEKLSDGNPKKARLIIMNKSGKILLNKYYYNENILSELIKFAEKQKWNTDALL